MAPPPVAGAVSWLPPAQRCTKSASVMRSRAPWQPPAPASPQPGIRSSCYARNRYDILIYIYIYIYRYIHIDVYNVYLNIYIYMCVCIYVYVYIYIYMCVCDYMCVFIYLSIYSFIYFFICLLIQLLVSIAHSCNNICSQNKYFPI